jgi:bifunctional non-homologous end joining protein LigD
VIGGYSQPEGTRPHFGSLLLGAYARDGLHYVGNVGTGFTLKTLADLYARLQGLRAAVSPFVDLTRRAGATWVRPALVAQVSFQEWTADRKLRQPVYLGLRDDKEPRECLLPSS